MSAGTRYSVGRHQLEVYASACGGGVGTIETMVDVIDLLPPETLEAVRQRVALRVVEALDAEAQRTVLPPTRLGPPAIGNVYLMRSNGLYKIGISRSVESRRAQLSTASGYAVEVVASWPMAAREACDVESALHEHFDAKRMNGEWFDLNDDDVATIAVMIASLP